VRAMGKRGLLLTSGVLGSDQHKGRRGRRKGKKEKIEKHPNNHTEGKQRNGQKPLGTWGNAKMNSWGERPLRGISKHCRARVKCRQD